MNKIIKLSLRLQHADFKTITKLLFKFGLPYWRTGKHSQDTSRQFGNKQTICQMSFFPVQFSGTNYYCKVPPLYLCMHGIWTRQSLMS